MKEPAGSQPMERKNVPEIPTNFAPEMAEGRIDASTPSSPGPEWRRRIAGRRNASRLPLRTALAVPVATVIAVAVHVLVATKQSAPETRSYTWFLAVLLSSAIVALIAQPFLAPLRRWMAHICPIIAAGIVALCVWEIITTGFHWLPMPYFPGPAGVLAGMIEDLHL